MTKDLWSEIMDTIQDRNVWEQNQDDWYKMRYEGIPRVAPPYLGAPDMHYPLIDSEIEKLKPFYIAQIYGQERLAAFASGKPQDMSVTLLAEKLFDYTTKQHTNFERAIHVSVDYMLLYGHGPMKIKYNNEDKKIEMVNVRPVYLVVPSYTQEINKADWLVHIIHMSEAQYRANKKFKTDKGFVDSIKGKGENRSPDPQQTIKRIEGITIGQNEKQIVVWECYSKNGGKWRIDTLSPMAGFDQPIRDPFYMPYKHNELPFCDIRYELGDVDFYGARGIGEILSQFELDLCKLWNHKLQWLDFRGQPNFKNTGGQVSNPSNFKNRPGKILPQGVEPVDYGQAPLDFAQEMAMQRSLAEDRISVPDLNAGQHLNPGQGQKGDVTARQISALMSQSTSGNDMRARVFRLQTGAIYKQIWALRCQYFQEEDQRLLEDFTEVPIDALHDTYRISPSGSADSYNKEFRTGKAMMRFQMFKGNPTIKQGELTKTTLEEDEPALVARLYQEPAEDQMNQMQLQGEEILLMKEGMPVQPKQTDADPVHIMTVAQWTERKIKMKEPVTPELASLCLQHIEQHVKQMGQKKDQQGPAVMQQPVVQIAMQFLETLAKSGQQQQPGQQPGGEGAPAGGADPSQQDKQSAQTSAAASLLTALGGLIKSGVVMDKNEVNAAMMKAGLPPLVKSIGALAEPPKPTTPTKPKQPTAGA